MGVKLWDYCCNDIGPTTPMVGLPVPMDMHAFLVNLFDLYDGDEDVDRAFGLWNDYYEAIIRAIKLTAYHTVKRQLGWPRHVPNFRVFIMYLSGMELFYLIDRYVPNRDFSRYGLVKRLSSNIFVQDIVLHHLPDNNIKVEELLRGCLFRPSIHTEFEPFGASNYDMVVPYDFITEDYINELARGIALYVGGDKPAKGMWYAG